jgi:poly-gamma-glutamate synthesis protein (capsule biosynthesis protein)
MNLPYRPSLSVKWCSNSPPVNRLHAVNKKPPGMVKQALPRVFLLLLLALTACSQGPAAAALALPTAAATLTPFQPQIPTPMPTPFGVWVSPAVPEGLRVVVEQSGLPPAGSKAEAGATLDLAGANSAGAVSTWVYALVSAFPTVRDGVSFDELKAAWLGSDPTLLMTASTQAAMQSVFGAPAGSGVTVVQGETLTDSLWQNRTQWAIVPFDALNERLKVLEVDGQSPLRKEFSPASYPLKATYALEPASFPLPAGNRDPEKLTTVLMTGTTALVRAISYKMQTNGVDYPARDIGDWLRNADILHISNEVAFTPDCPAPDPNSGSLRFCSAVENSALLENIGVDVIELTGNHVNDWGTEALSYTLDLYQQHGWPVFGGGANLAAGFQPVILERAGVKFAFIGCNTSGPDFAWATETTPGAAPCGDYGWLVDAIKVLKASGAVVIVTLQHYEYYTPDPRPNQLEDFRRLADAGADIVSGSQAHYSQSMEFYNNAFIHYGLGNLFFDQMGYSYADGTRTLNTRREFLDRYVFYNGRLIGIELLTAMLEDYSKPRPMTLEERQLFLQEYFAASGWEK